MVQDVLAGEPPRDERVRHEELSVLLPDVGLVAPQPEQLRADGLGREHGPATRKQDVLSVALVEFLYLPGRSRVYAVEDSGSQRPASLVRREEAGPDTARADRGYWAVGLR